VRQADLAGLGEGPSTDQGHIAYTVNVDYLLIRSLHIFVLESPQLCQTHSKTASSG
jgi:hypothetical protein